MISFFTDVSSGTWLLQSESLLGCRPCRSQGAAGSLPISGVQRPLHEGAARRGQLPTGRNSRYHAGHTAWPLLSDTARRGATACGGAGQRSLAADEARGASWPPAVKAAGGQALPDSPLVRAWADDIEGCAHAGTAEP